MSVISTLYDAMYASVAAQLSGHTRLPNPYKVEENPEPYLIKGFGIKIADATNTFRELSCKLSISRNFVVVISRKAYAKETDITGKETTEKDLLEDMFLVVKEVELNTTINSASYAGRVSYQADSGIQYVSDQKDNFYKLEITFSIEYMEHLT